jgi:Icc-related predicted phosphoesterase
VGATVLKIAATADIHARTGDTVRLRALADGAARDADMLVMGGDLTDLGKREQAEALLEALSSCSIPIVATLGNHDHESGDVDELSRLFAKSGIHLLDRSSVVVDGVGFSGVKGFCGGFDRALANAFGEDLFKAWVNEGLEDAEALENELRGLGTERRVAVLHYAPISATVEGEPPQIYPFLGTSHLARALDRGDATIAFHGHAHSGSFEGRTPGGVPVFNVAVPVLQQAGLGQPYYVFEV